MSCKHSYSYFPELNGVQGPDVKEGPFKVQMETTEQIVLQCFRRWPETRPPKPGRVHKHKPHPHFLRAIFAFARSGQGGRNGVARQLVQNTIYTGQKLSHKLPCFVFSFLDLLYAMSLCAARGVCQVAYVNRAPGCEVVLRIHIAMPASECQAQTLRNHMLQS